MKCWKVAKPKKIFDIQLLFSKLQDFLVPSLKECQHRDAKHTFTTTKTALHENSAVEPHPLVVSKGSAWVCIRSSFLHQFENFLADNHKCANNLSNRETLKCDSSIHFSTRCVQSLCMLRHF